MDFDAQQTMGAFLQGEIDEHRSTLEATQAQVAPAFERAVLIAERCIREGGKLLLFGNGGSASDAQHIHQPTSRPEARKTAGR